jgi:transposase
MPRYTVEFKEKVVQKMMPPNAQSLSAIHRETGISVPTLSAWRKECAQKGRAVPADPANPEHWSGRDKLAVVVETASLNEHALSEYCRTKGLYPEQVERWREAAVAGNEAPQPLSAKERESWREDRKRARDLERELHRKEKALAETAALLVLKKKAQQIWGGCEVE